MESLFLLYLLHQAEKRVEAAPDFDAMRAALEAIRDQRLYLVSPDAGRRKSFPTYCRRRFGLGTIAAAPDAPTLRGSGPEV